MQPPQLEHKTNTRPFCVGDRSLSAVSCLPFFFSFSILASLCVSLSLTCSLSFSALQIGLWQHYDAFLIIPITLAKLPCLSGPLGSVHWLLPQPEGYTSLFLCLRAVSEQRWNQEMDSILQQIIQPQATDDCLLHAAHCDQFIKADVNKCSQEALR